MLLFEQFFSLLIFHKFVKHWNIAYFSNIIYIHIYFQDCLSIACHFFFKCEKAKFQAFVFLNGMFLHKCFHVSEQTLVWRLLKANYLFCMFFPTLKLRTKYSQNAVFGKVPNFYHLLYIQTIFVITFNNYDYMKILSKIAKNNFIKTV